MPLEIQMAGRKKRKHEVAASPTLLFPGRPKKNGGGVGQSGESHDRFQYCLIGVLPSSENHRWLLGFKPEMVFPPGPCGMRAAVETLF